MHDQDPEALSAEMEKLNELLGSTNDSLGRKLDPPVTALLHPCSKNLFFGRAENLLMSVGFRAGPSSVVPVSESATGNLEVAGSST